MTIPNFCIVGAAKSGTTSLYSYVDQHPQVYMSPVKEPKFFGLIGEKPNFCGPGDEKINSILITDPEEYQSLFDGVTSEKAIGEASPWYLYFDKAAAQIYNYIPDVKIIAILRNPVDRAYSNFLHQLRAGAEPHTDFAKALQEEEMRVRSHWRPFWYYKQLGLYYQQLQRYFALFDTSQIKVYLYESFRDRPTEVVQSIFRFLEIDDTFVPDVSERHNVSYLPRNRSLYNLTTRSTPIKSAISTVLPTKLRQGVKATLSNFNRSSTKPEITPEVRKQLIEEYREDVLKLQDLIHTDLSHWLN